MLRVDLEKQLASFHLNLAFQAERGQTTVLLGESGAGKSTVLRLLAGLLHPDRGLIELNGVPYVDSTRELFRTPQERPFGYVFQDYTLFPHLTVFENVAFGLKAQGLPFRLVRQRVGEALEQVHFVGYDRQWPDRLSGGQQQRVALARALALQPHLLLLDEPLSALDVQTRREVRQELRRLLQQSEITTLLVTHHYLDALLFGQQILVLDAGRLIQQGTHQDLLRRPRSSYVAELVGVNFLRGRVVGCEGSGVCTLRLEDNGAPGIEVQATLAEDARSQESVPRPQVGAEAFIVVDPRAVTLSLIPPEGSARNVLRGEIAHILHTNGSGAENAQHSGWVRVSLLSGALAVPFLAEVTESSAQRLGLSEGSQVYAAFKAMEARAYM